MERPATDIRHYHPSPTDGDLLPIVDEQDCVIGSGTRREIHVQGLRHRGVHIVVIDGAGSLLLQKRSACKDSHPGWWDISVGGHVDVGEDYEAAAAREMMEELGIAAPAREVARRPASAENGWEFVRIYEAVWSGGLPPFNRAEIDAVRWVDARRLAAEARTDHPDEAWRVTGAGLGSIRLWAAAQWG